MKTVVNELENDRGYDRANLIARYLNYRYSPDCYVHSPHYHLAGLFSLSSFLTPPDFHISMACKAFIKRSVRGDFLKKKKGWVLTDSMFILITSFPMAEQLLFSAEYS
jgi:hypothetical protein